MLDRIDLFKMDLPELQATDFDELRQFQQADVSLDTDSNPLTTSIKTGP